jgi:hypothetical protein
MEDARRRLEECIYGDWEIYGDSNRISDKLLKSEVGKCHINHRFTLGKLILAGEPKTPEYLSNTGRILLQRGFICCGWRSPSPWPQLLGNEVSEIVQGRR